MPKQTGVIRFSVEGALCYLSHQETVTMWQRILIRARIPLAWRGGFNPRPQMSLPFPRPVGIQAEDDVLVLRLEEEIQPNQFIACWAGLDKHLPKGCQILDIQQYPQKHSLQPIHVVYVLKRNASVAQDRWGTCLEAASQQLQGNDCIEWIRHRPSGKQTRINLNQYIQCIHGDSERIEIRCLVTPAGTVRVDELLGWLTLSPLDLAMPVRRKSIQWICN